MIVRERKDAFVMIEQHHHGKIAGQLYDHLNDSLSPPNKWYEAISQAIINHDCGWIPFDAEPFWDDEAAVPYSFSDFPIGPKIVLYEYGINQVSKKSLYAALLCSIHYVSFLQTRKDDLSKQFVKNELVRQDQIKKDLHITDDTLVKNHYEILKFFDDFSLYICLNEPGVSQSNTHFFFKEGLTVPTIFQQQKLQLDWHHPKEIIMNQHLFKNNDVTIQLHQKVISKNTIKKLGVKKAFHEEPIEIVPITISHTK